MSIAAIATTPRPPYYAVIFSSLRRDGDADDYATASERMLELAAQMPGFLGVDSARGTDGMGITVSYWTDQAAILAWKRHAEHAAVRERGRSAWYRDFSVRIARVERAYGQGEDAHR